MLELAMQEKLKNEVSVVEVLSLRKDETNPNVVLCTVNLEGKGIDAFSYEEELGRVELKKIDIPVRYVGRHESGQFKGFMGWIAEPEMIARPNRERGCFKRKLELPQAVIDRMISINKGNEPWVRRKCEAHEITFKVRPDDAAILNTAADKLPEYTFKDCSEGRGFLGFTFKVAECEHMKVCANDFSKTTYFPAVHCGEDGKTTGFRMICACAAAVVGRHQDPCYPDRPGVYLGKDQKPKYYYTRPSDKASCSLCLNYAYAMRANDDDDDSLRQSSIAMQKCDGIDPIHFCRYQNEWLRRPSELMQDMNSQGVKSSSGFWKGEVIKALRESVCSKYTWAHRYNVFLGTPDYETEKRGLWNPFIPAVGTVDFIDIPGEVPRIEAFAPGYKVVMGINERAAAFQRKFKL